MKGILTGHHQVWHGLAGMLAAMPMLVWATTVTVNVTVVAPPACVINDNNPIEVEFGDVITTRVDGNNYRVPVTYSLNCNGPASNAMKLQVQGNSAAFDNTVLGTSVGGLGIELRQDATKLHVNTWLNFTYPQKPALWAVPVKDSRVTLAASEFTASATMKVDYT